MTWPSLNANNGNEISVMRGLSIGELNGVLGIFLITNGTRERSNTLLHGLRRNISFCEYFGPEANKDIPMSRDAVITTDIGVSINKYCFIGSLSF